MKFNLKRLLSLAMAVVMTVQILPLYVFAQGEQADSQPTSVVTEQPSAQQPVNEEQTAENTEGAEPVLQPSDETIPVAQDTPARQSVAQIAVYKKISDGNWVQLPSNGETEPIYLHTNLGGREELKFENLNAAEGTTITVAPAENDNLGSFATIDIQGNVIALTFDKNRTEYKAFDFVVTESPARGDPVETTVAVTIDISSNSGTGAGTGNGGYGHSEYKLTNYTDRYIDCKETDRPISLGGGSGRFQISTPELEAAGGSQELFSMRSSGITSGFRPVYIFEKGSDGWIKSLVDDNGNELYDFSIGTFSRDMSPYMTTGYKYFKLNEKGYYEPVEDGAEGSVAVYKITFKKADNGLALPKSVANGINVYIFNKGDQSRTVGSGDVSIMGDGMQDLYRKGCNISATENPENLFDANSENDSMAFILGGTIKTQMSTKDDYAKNVYAYFTERTFVEAGNPRQMIPDKYSYAFADKNKITIHSITSDNTDFVTVNQGYEETYNDKAAYGFSVTMNPGATERFAEVKIVYSVTGVSEPVTLYWGFSRTSEIEPESITDEEAFIKRYNEMTTGIIIVKEKEGEDKNYYMDINHVKGIHLIAEGNVVIAGKTGNNGPVVKLSQASANHRFEGFTIDGDGDKDGVKRVGLDANGFQIMYSDLNFINCSIGVTSSVVKEFGASGFVLANSTFKANDTAILLNGNAAAVNLNGNTFEDNGTAISIEKDSFGYFNVHVNKFKGNTTDFRLKSDYNRLNAQQNYYFHKDAADVNKPVIEYSSDKTGVLYYAPFYRGEDFTVLSGDITGAEGAKYTDGVSRQADVTELNVPVNLTLSDKSTVFDKTLFEEIKTNTKEYNVTIPVTENTDGKTLVSTVWTFDESSLAKNLPDDMNLKVTDELEEKGETVINDKLRDTSVIAQKVHFDHEGILPGKSEVKVLKTGTSTVTDGLKLYQVKAEEGEIVEADFPDVRVEGDYYVVTVDHCSEYIIATAITIKPEPTPTPEATPSPTPEVTPTPETTPSPETPSTGNTGSAGGATSRATPAPAVKPTAKPETEQEENVNANEFVDAVEIEEKFENSTGNTVTIDAGEKSLISSKAFEILEKSEDKELVIQGEDYSWKFKAEDIKDADAIGASVFNPLISFESPNAEEIENYTEGQEVINLYFSYHGQLPGKAEITVYAGVENAGKTMYLYYFNSELGRMEYIDTVTVDENGNVTFVIDHCSDYILSPVKLENATYTQTEEQDAQPTAEPVQDDRQSSEGFSFGILPVIVLGIAAIVVYLAISAKKQKDE